MALALLVATFLGAGVLMIFIALAQISVRSALMEERMRQAALLPGAASPTLSRPFAERLMVPLDEFLRRRTPAERLRRSRDRISLAGKPIGLTVGRLLLVKAIIGILTTVVVAALLFGAGIAPLGLGLISVGVVAVLLGLVGYYLPDLLVQQAVQRRKEQIRRQLPEVCDLLSVCVDAGASFDLALARVVDSPYMAGPLVDEFKAVLRQIQYSTGRLEALNHMADRLDIEELRVFVTGMGESFKRGAPIADELRVLSEDVRERYREHAEERANQATVKLLIPMIFLIFPTLWIVILTPALIQVAYTVTGGR